MGQSLSEGSSRSSSKSRFSSAFVRTLRCVPIDEREVAPGRSRRLSLPNGFVVFPVYGRLARASIYQAARCLSAYSIPVSQEKGRLLNENLLRSEIGYRFGELPKVGRRVVWAPQSI